MACAVARPFDRGDVSVVLERATVVNVSRHEIFRTAAEPSASISAVRFDISSETDLASFFEGRLIQVRCFVTGPEDGRRYLTFGVGPFEGSLDLSDVAQREHVVAQAAANTTHQYTVYAFLGLKAEDSKFEEGRPRGEYDLVSRKFESAGCFLVGVTMWPFGWPKSSTFVISSEEFISGLAALGDQR